MSSYSGSASLKEYFFSLRLFCFINKRTPGVKIIDIDSGLLDFMVRACEMTEDLTILIEGFGRETESQMIHVSRCSFA